MDMFDEAEAIRSTMKLCGLTQAKLADQLGVSQSYVANKLRLLALSDTARERIRALGLSERHARSLLRIEKEDERIRLIDEIGERGLTVRECEARVDELSLPNLPRGFSRADALRKIELFRASISDGAATLTASGVDATTRTSYHDGDMYITVVIKNA